MKRSISSCVAVVVLCLSMGYAHQPTHDGKTQSIDSELFVVKDYSYGGVGEVHSATIAQAKNGDLVCAFYGGYEEGEDDVGIYVSRFSGSSWTNPQRVENANGDTVCWNPVLFQPSGPNAPLLLWYKHGGWHNNLLDKPNSKEGWHGVIKTSNDNGNTWSSRKDLPSTSNNYFSKWGAQYIGPTKNKPLEMPDGSLLCGSSIEKNERSDWNIHIEKVTPSDYTTGYSVYWGPNNSNLFIQPAFLYMNASKTNLKMVVREGVNGDAEIGSSSNSGESWGSFSTISVSGSITALKGGIDAQTLNNGWHVIVGSQGSDRQNGMLVAISDDAQSWSTELMLEKNVGSGYHGQDGHRVEYPSVILDKNNKLQLVYTTGDHIEGAAGRGRNKKCIKHVTIDPDILTGTSTHARTAVDLKTTGASLSYREHQSRLDFQGSVNTTVDYSLYRLCGQKVASAAVSLANGKGSVSVEHFPNGTYLVVSRALHATRLIAVSK
ncbi:MAG: hypothetical protein GF398_16390 [Chitinivibrionales bacterium]|nr:hypothetical protein [Chitinivibrionales bacterium]